jgi:hypothetical protein
MAGKYWLPPDTPGWELVPGPHACPCGMPACRSGWEWQPVASTDGPARDDSAPRPSAGRRQAEHEAEAGT